jgi:hypothetical protein
MKFSLLVFIAILVLAIGSTITPCRAVASDLPSHEASTAINAIITNNPDAPGFGSFQASYLSLSLTTDKPVYLTGDTINITVTTSAVNTYVSLQAQLPDGSEQTIENFTVSYTHTVSWTAPSTSGQIRLTCDGEATVEVWDYCNRYVCTDSSDCHWDTYPCVRSTSVTGNAYNYIRIFSRTTSVSGRIIDTNQQPVAGAAVSILGAAQSTVSDSDGYYKFNSYQLGNNYTLVNQIPTVTDTISVEAVACEPQPGKSVQIQAEHGASEVNFTLQRAFYPPDIDLSEFTFAAFPNWPDANDYATWQNIAGITVDGPVQPTKWQYGNKEISPLLFNIGNKKLYLITQPAFGRYYMDVQGAPNTPYIVAAAATINGDYLQPITVNTKLGSSGSQRARLTLQQNQMQLQVTKLFPVLLIIIPIVLVTLGGLAAAYFLTGGKRRWGKVISRRKPSETTEITVVKQPARRKATVKTKAKRPARRRIKKKRSTGKAG